MKEYKVKTGLLVIKGTNYVVDQILPKGLLTDSVASGLLKDDAIQVIGEQVVEKAPVVERNPLDVNNDGKVDLKDIAEVAKGAAKKVFGKRKRK